MGSEGPQVCKVRALQIAILVDLRVIETLSYLSRLRGFPASRIHPGPHPL